MPSPRQAACSTGVLSHHELLQHELAEVDRSQHEVSQHAFSQYDLSEHESSQRGLPLQQEVARHELSQHKGYEHGLRMQQELLSYGVPLHHELVQQQLAPQGLALQGLSQQESSRYESPQRARLQQQVSQSELLPQQGFDRHEFSDGAQHTRDETRSGQPIKPASLYSSWSADAIRKECTRRGLRLKASLKKPERIDILLRHDVAKAAFGSVLLGDVGSEEIKSGKTAIGSRTKHCMYRLLNILFSDDFAARFSESGNKPPRADLDTRAVNDKSSFWLDVRSAFIQTYPEAHALHQLVADDELFQGIDTSEFKPHSAKKLYDMWKEVDKLYVVAEKEFTASGQHENEFRNFVNGCGYVLYLQKWLSLKPEIINFAKGGLLSTDEFDTLEDSQGAAFQSPNAKSTPSKGKRGSHEHMEVFAGAFVEYVKDRRVEAERASASASSHLKEKSSILEMLRDIRHQLSELDIELEKAGEASMERLKEDRTLLLSQRQSLIKQLQSDIN